MKEIVKEVHQSNVMLCRAVKKHRSLYDVTVPEYSLKQHTQRTWEAVAKECNIPASECRHRWRNLRISYLRYLRQCRAADPSKKLKPYYLLSEMNFMEAHVRLNDRADLSSTSKIEYEVESQEDESLVFTIKGNPSRTRRRRRAGQPEFITAEIIDVGSPKQSATDLDKFTEGENDEEEEEDEDDIIHEENLADIDITQQSQQHQMHEHSHLQLQSQQQQQQQFQQAQDQTMQSLITDLSHSDLAFFRSLLPDVESMSMEQKSKFKLKVLTALNEILYG